VRARGGGGHRCREVRGGDGEEEEGAGAGAAAEAVVGREPGAPRVGGSPSGPRKFALNQREQMIHNLNKCICREVQCDEKARFHTASWA